MRTNKGKYEKKMKEKVKKEKKKTFCLFFSFGRVVSVQFCSLFYFIFFPDGSTTLKRSFEK